MKIKNGCILAFACIFAILTSSGCATIYGNKNRYRSSVADYLYPKKDVVEQPSVPHLSLPLRVGVAFVPDSQDAVGNSRISEKEKMDLLKNISAEFRSLEFVKHIELIPTAYLLPRGGFANLDQIRALHDIDVAVLVSYDQMQHTDEGFWSLSYWTIVGAYVIKGEKNDTLTMLDATVYDIASRKMLFRAPGTNQMKGSATLVNLPEQLRVDSSESFHLAALELVNNLKAALEDFKEKVKENPAEFSVVHKPGYTGLGSMSGPFAVVIIVLGGLGLWRKQKG